MRRGFKILFLLLVPMLGNGQEKVTDSLRKALNIARTDSAKFSITTALSTNNMERDWDSALYYSEKALQLAQKNNKQLEIARTLDIKGYVLKNSLIRFARTSHQMTKIVVYASQNIQPDLTGL